MKIRTTLITLLIFTSVHGQIPDYFGHNPKWSFVKVYDSPQIYECTETTNYSYSITGDTIIQGHSYNILHRKWILQQSDGAGSPYPECLDSWYGEEDYRFLRQAGDSIFWFSPFNSMDELMISYNLQIGDMMQPTIFAGDYQTIIDIDTLYLSGIPHRVFHTDFSQQIIEGVAHFWSVEGYGEFVDHWEYPWDTAYTMLCYSQNDITLWNNPNLPSSCEYLDDLSTTELADQLISTYPNPTRDIVTITLFEEFNGTVYVVGFDGKIVQSLETSFQDTFDLNCNGLTSGVYTLILQSSDTSYRQKKIVKL